MELKDKIADEIASNAAYQNILTRRSVRQYTTQPVSDDAVTALLHAGMAAPSGVNKQPWEFIVVENREARLLGRNFANLYLQELIKYGHI